MSIKFITDSASDIAQGSKKDVIVLPMTIGFGEEEYKDGVNLTHEEFYGKLIESDVLPKTSQIPPYDFECAIKEASADGSEIVIVTMSSKLSGTYQSACMAVSEYPKGVYVVDSENVTVGEMALIEYGLELREQGKTASEIADTLNSVKKNIHLVALLDTLEYLKKGGRISKTAAFAGSLLSIKPVIAIEDGEVAMLGKARGSRQGNNLLVQQIEQAGGIAFDMPLFLGYTGLSDNLLTKYISDSRPLWEDHIHELKIFTVGGTIGTHAGPGAIAVAFFAKKK